MLFFLIILVLCLVCVHVHIRYGAYGKIINKIPGPTPLPFIGNILLLNKRTENFWTFLESLMMQYYPIMRFWFCITGLVIVQDPDDLKIILSDKVNIMKGYMYKSFHIISKSGLVTSTGEIWQKRRKMIEPAFHINRIKKNIEIAADQGDLLIKSLKAHGDESVQSLMTICSDITLSIIIEAAMGVKLKTMGDKANEYKEAVEYICDYFIIRALNPYIKDWMLKFHSKGRKLLTSIKICRDFADTIIQQRRKYHNDTKFQKLQGFLDDKIDIGSNEEGCKMRIALLDLLLAAEKDNLIDEHGIKEEVDTFISAGYDTTAMEMVYILMQLAENKEVQELARAEVNRILSATGDNITFKEIQQMEYIDRCIKECLRLFPTVPYIGRTLIKDVQLTNYKVPSSTEILIPIFSINRDPKFWADPLKFNPDRFLPEEVLKHHPFAYAPFSHGPRSCIGQKFAMAEMKTLTAKILRNFYLEPVDYTKDLKFKLHIVLAPTIRPKIKFIKIKK